MMLSLLINELKLNNGIKTKLSLLNYRIGFIEKFCNKNKSTRFILSILYKLLRVINFIFGSYIIPKTTFIDWGLRVPHGFKGMEISYRAKVGKNCVLYHNTTIGTIESTGKYPVIGDNVYIGAHCLLIGEVTIGDNCKIGAGTRIFNQNIPKNSTVINPIEYRIIIQ